MDINLSLIQGKKFKKYQNKISNNIEKSENIYFKKNNKSNKRNNLKEGFDNILETNQATMSNVRQQNISDSMELNRLKTQFDTVLQEYISLESSSSGTMKELLGRYGPNNSYNGKNLVINNGDLGYVTERGVFKWYGSPEISANTRGKNGCPASLETVDISNYQDYNTPGKVLNTSPSLLVGSSMISGQSCGNEGKNVYVDSLVPKNVKTTYNGCYADQDDSRAMTFLGNSPSPPAGNLQNGNFDQPQINNDSYQSISSNDQVPGWNFYAFLINNSTAWGFPTPYPTGNQCAVIQSRQSIYQWIQLTAGTYNISFYSSIRPINNSSNTLYIRCGTSSTIEENPIVTNFTGLPQWIHFNNIPLKIPSDGLYNLSFNGSSDEDYSTAIQNIEITQISSSGGPEYTYDMCKEDAINNGYKYFALQNMNPSTGYGYCAVTNDQIGATKYGTSKIASEITPLWSSETQNNPGSSAILNMQGSLSVVNSSGASIFSTPVATNIPSSYIGCYGDKEDRAMTFPDGGVNQVYNYESCEKIAQDGNYAYFGLQNSTTGENAQCSLSNDFGQLGKYGLANNCTTLSNGIVSGGAWSNAVYGTSPSGQYYLSLEYNDTGAVGIYIWRGAGPSNNQGQIWSFNTTGAKDPNPNYAASKGKYGQNWIPVGSTLAPGDFVGTTNGCAYLMMQSDGNLVLYTSKMVDNCLADQNNNMGGGQNANAIYMLDAVGNPSSMGKIGYVDNEANLREYPSSMIGKSNTYQKYSNYDSIGNDLGNMPLTNSTADNCQSACNENGDCNGFVYDTNNQLCYLKDNNMYPVGTRKITNGLDLYTRTPSLNNNPLCPKDLIPIDSIQYDNYVKGDPMTAQDNCNSNLLSDEEKAKLDDLSNQLNTISNQIETKINKLYSNNSTINNTMDKGAKTMNSDFKMYYEVKENINKLLEKNTNKTDKKNIQKINNFNSNNIVEPMLNMNDLNAMINDTDLVVLQSNYQYVMWSILAVGLVAVTINIIKK